MRSDLVGMALLSVSDSTWQLSLKSAGLHLYNMRFKVAAIFSTYYPHVLRCLIISFIYSNRNAFHQTGATKTEIVRVLTIYFSYWKCEKIYLERKLNSIFLML